MDFGFWAALVASLLALTGAIISLYATWHRAHLEFDLVSVAIDTTHIVLTVPPDDFVLDLVGVSEPKVRELIEMHPDQVYIHLTLEPNPLGGKVLSASLYGKVDARRTSMIELDLGKRKDIAPFFQLLLKRRPLLKRGSRWFRPRRPKMKKQPKQLRELVTKDGQHQKSDEADPLT
jgi:hypothetical protein